MREAVRSALVSRYGETRWPGVAVDVDPVNHPSGDPTPSREDLRLTRQLAECARMLDLRLHDHVIIGHGRYVSLAQRGAI